MNRIKQCLPGLQTDKTIARHETEAKISFLTDKEHEAINRLAPSKRRGTPKQPNRGEKERSGAVAHRRICSQGASS